MLCCPGCGSRFFKTLELRFELVKRQIQALLYKKRCKRCKEKLLVEMTVVQGKPRYALASACRWKGAVRANSSRGAFESTVKCALVSDYTRFISSDTAKIFYRLLSRERRTGGEAPC